MPPCSGKSVATRGHARLDRLAAGHEKSLVRLRRALAEPKRAIDVFGALFARPIEGSDLLGMLAQARQRGVYEHLEQGDIAAYLASTDRSYDLVAAADVFTYVGALDDVFAGVARVLQADGLFGFAVEAADDAPDGFVLRPSLRYAHARGYLEALAQRHGFGVRSLQRQPIREDQRTTIDAWYGVLSR